MGIKYYTGIGSEETPEDIRQLMTRLAYHLEKRGYVLRSGGSEGADRAFEDGIRNANNKEIYIPWSSFNDRTANDLSVHVLDPNDTIAISIATEVYPVWEKLTQGEQKLYTRSVYQVLGLDLKTPSDMVIFWAPVNRNNKIKGKTAVAVNLAWKNKISIINMYYEQEKTKIIKWLERVEANKL